MVLTAIIFMLFLVPFLCGLIDSAYTLIAWGQISQEVFQGARAGASSLDQADLTNGQFTLDPATAVANCQTFLAENEATLPASPTILVAKCTTSGNAVKAELSVRLKLPFPFPINDVITTSYTAQLQHGVNSPS